MSKPLGGRMSGSDREFSYCRFTAENSAQSTNRARITIVTQRSAANLTGPFAFRTHAASPVRHYATQI